MLHEKYQRLFYTICIFLNHFAFGISSNILWPALVDLRYVYGTTIETISYLVAFSSFGYLLGSLFGLLYQWINRQMTLALLCALLALTLALIPFYHYLWLLFVGTVLMGLGGGCWDSGNNIFLVEIWTTSNAPVMQSSQFMYGLGTIVGPLIVGPYVHGEDNSTAGETWSGEERQKQLTFPFALAGGLQILVPTVLFISFFIFRYKKVDESAVLATPSQNWEEKRSSSDSIIDTVDAINQPKPVSNRGWKIFAMAVCLAGYDAAEIGYFYFAPSAFQYMEVHMEAFETARMSSILSGAYTFGRLFSAIVSLKVSPDIIIAYHFIIIAFAQVFLFLVRHNKLLIYIGNGFLGFGFSAMWPAILAFTERHLRLSDKAGTALFFSAGVMSLFTPFIVGHFLEAHPLVLFVFELIYLSTSAACYVVIKLLLLPFF